MTDPRADRLVGRVAVGEELVWLGALLLPDVAPRPRVVEATLSVPRATLDLMPGLRGEELWVGACVEAALPGVRVVQHDDGSESGMYDLDLLHNGGQFAAMEVTAAADAESIELWNLVNGSENRWIESKLLGGWMVTVTPKARAKRLKKELPQLLRMLETVVTESERDVAIDHLHELEVVSADRSDTKFPGSIYITLQRGPERTGGAVPLTGDGLVVWLNEWMCEPGQVHNLNKLRAANCRERHLFLLLPGFTTAPVSASDVLMRADGPLPEVPPVLPQGITDVWVMSTWSTGDLFHFGAEGWSRSRKVFEVASS